MHENIKKQWNKHFDFLVCDVIAIQIAFILSYLFKNGWDNLFEIQPYRHVAFVLLFLPMFVTFFVEPYSGILRRGWVKELIAVCKQMLLILLLLFAYMFALRITGDYSRLVFFYFALIGVFTVYSIRYLLKYALHRKRKKGKIVNYLFLVCDQKDVERVVKKLLINQYSTWKLVGIVLVDSSSDFINESFEEKKEMIGKRICGIPVVATKETMMEYFRTHVVDDVLLHLKTENVTTLAETLVEMGIAVHVKINQVFDEKLDCQADRLNGIPVLTATMRQIRPEELFVKRCIDICGGLVGVILTIIIFIFVAPIIYLQSPGPIFFSQQRVGKNGRKFKIYKFRSMYLDAEERKKELMEQNKMNGFMFKIDNDPRIFPFGNFIRKTSLDEFPQFFNVLKGEMSLVGTRPPTVDEYEQYELHHKGRLAMKPGLTGMWQASGRSEITDFEEVVRLDTEYIRNWSLGLDVKILLKTALIVVMGKGAE